MQGIIDRLHHLTLPRESNNHRAKLLHHSSLLVIIALLLVTQFGFTLTEKKYPDVLGVTNNISIDDLTKRTNDKRAEAGLAPLSYNAELSNAAGQKAQHMLNNNYWAHNAPDGTTPWVFFKNSGYQYIFAGENLARGFSNTEDVLNAWMASPGHKENILSPNYKEIGFAVVTGTLTGEETVLVVEMFGNRGDTVAQETQSKSVSEPVAPKAPVIVAIQSTPIPTQVQLVTPLPTQVVEKVDQNRKKDASIVASVQSKPLVNEKKVSKNITVVLVLILLAVLILDLFVIERKKIIRVVSHNLDHIIYLSIILITIILFGKGLIL